MADLLVDSPESSAAVVRDVLAGAKGAPRDMVVLNAAAALTIAGRADDIGAAVPIAQGAIDDGAAAKALEKLVQVSNA
jgi:anthranilate phosphoribosyltransferase